MSRGDNLFSSPSTNKLKWLKTNLTRVLGSEKPFHWYLPSSKGRTSSRLLRLNIHPQAAHFLPYPRRPRIRPPLVSCHHPAAKGQRLKNLTRFEFQNQRYIRFVFSTTVIIAALPGDSLSADGLLLAKYNSSATDYRKIAGTLCFLAIRWGRNYQRLQTGLPVLLLFVIGEEIVLSKLALHILPPQLDQR